jgi:hypothetical protein
MPQIININEGTKLTPEINGNSVTFPWEGGGISFGLNARERDYEVILDVTMSVENSLTLGYFEGLSVSRVAQIIIPPRAYDTQEVEPTEPPQEGENAETIYEDIPRPFDMDGVTIKLWALEG